MKDKKILIIQTAFLGDVILALPMVQTLKLHLPDAKLDFLCIPQTAVVLSGHPDINAVIPYDKKGGDKLDKFIEVLSEIRENEYDIVFCPHRFSRSALLTYYSEAKIRIGFEKNSLSFLLTDKVKYIKDRHEIYRNLDLVKALPGLDYDENKVSLKPNLYPSEEGKKKAEHLLHRSNLITFAPCSKWFTKQLTLDKSLEIIRKLIFKGYNIALIGGSEDSDYCNELEKRVSDSSLINLCGRLNPLESYYVITRSKALITVDSAAQHLGAASDTPIVLIYGSTDMRFGFYPLTSKYRIAENNTLDCRPCTDHGRDNCPLGHFKCIEGLNADEIILRTEELINPGRMG
jgi:heptosyltransferase-2